MPRHNNTVAMFDDNAEVVEAYRLLFQQDGYTFLSADNPADALALYEKIKHNPPRFAIVDVIFKSFTSDKPNGFQLCRQLREIDPDGIFIVLTGMPDELTRIRLIDSKADLILEKPKSDIEILAAVHRIEHDRDVSKEQHTKSIPSGGKFFLCAFAAIFGAMILAMTIGFGGIIAVGYHFYAVEKEGHAREMKERQDAEKQRFVDFMDAMRREQDLKLADMRGQINYLEPRVKTLEKELSQMHGEMRRR